MAADSILVIDQGTHSTRAIVFDGRGQLLATARRPVALTRSSHTEIEQSPNEIVDSMYSVINSVLEDPAVEPERIRIAGLATQRSSVVAWDRATGKPLSPVLSWQDRRTAEAIDALAPHAPMVREITGLRLSPHYGGGKLQWLLQHSKPVRAALAEGRLLMGPLASYLLFHLLTDRPALVDHANASRTLLWNLHTRDWDARMLSLFEVPRDTLPQCRPIQSNYGRLAAHDISLCAVNGDQTAALYAQGLPPANMLIVNIGTGAFVLMPTESPMNCPDGLLAGISHSDDASGRYYFEGTVNGAAAAVKMIAQRFAVEDIKTELPEWLARVDSPTLFINTVGGLGAPWWRSGPDAYFIDAPKDAAEALVAVIESIVFLLQANIERMCRQNPSMRTVRISGGLSNLDGLCQKLADLSGLTVHRPTQVEATARGVAWQAAGGPADWPPGGAGKTFSATQDTALAARYQRFTDVLETL